MAIVSLGHGCVDEPTGAGRLWKCRGRGNHRAISTAAWKSREEREIPTFPQADSWLFDLKNGKNTNPGAQRLDKRHADQAG